MFIPMQRSNFLSYSNVKIRYGSLGWKRREKSLEHLVGYEPIQSTFFSEGFSA